jgi:hypothetical protein
MSHRCASLEYLLAIAISAALFCVRPPSATIPGTASTGRRGGFEWGDDSDPDNSRSFHEKAVEHSLLDWNGRIA